MAFGAMAEERDATPEAPQADDVEDTQAEASRSAPATEETKPPSAASPREPPPTLSITEARGPDVTLIAGENRNVYEYRQNGKLRLIKVVPENGKPYFLAPRDPTQGFGDLEQADMLVPEWVLIEF